MAYLVKPIQFYYVPPDIVNFPTQNKELARDFNFLAEMFKFMSKVDTVAFAGNRLAGEEDIKDGTAHDLAGWQISDEWYQALNEYEIPDYLTETIATGRASDSDETVYNRTGDPNWRPKNNFEAIEKTGTWAFDGTEGNLVAGFTHFNNGLDKEYFWGENVASSLGNVDYDVQGCEWNHLEERKPLGLAGFFMDNDTRLPKDINLDPDVNRAYFIGDFLASISGSSAAGWAELQGILNKLSGQSYYQMVMNGVYDQGPDYRAGSSYAALSAREQTILIAAMVESRNRVYKVASDIFGPVALTWSDRDMIANFKYWMATHYTQGLSHGINAFRLILETSHLMLNQIYQFSKTTNYNDAGYPMSMLDRYAFWQYNQASGAEYYNKFRSYGDYKANSDGLHPTSDNKGSIFGLVDSIMRSYTGTGLDADENAAVRNWLCQPLPLQYQLSYDTTVGQMPDPPGAETMDPREVQQLKAMKWLIEQWFGASTWVRPNYNNMPKPVGLAPSISTWPGVEGVFPRDGAGYDIQGGKYVELWKEENINGKNVLVPQTIYDPNSSRSYGWDRVGGSFGWGEDNFTTQYGGDIDIWSGTNEWYGIYNVLRSKYGNLGYVSPNVPAYNTMLIGMGVNQLGCHNLYTRKQFTGLDEGEVLGRKGFTDPYGNSWAVRIEGDLTQAGKKTDNIRMNIYTTLDKAGTRRYHREEEKYREDKDQQKRDEADEQKQAEKIRQTQRAEQKHLEQKAMAEAQQRRKAARNQTEKAGAQKAKKS
ncbi:MAG: hypothetical protein JW873_01275 [Candidatus Saganbacteria bacterium]|nr:hypothetical protein [Candidatus Saganbacteria bacterium]